MNATREAGFHHHSSMMQMVLSLCLWLCCSDFTIPAVHGFKCVWFRAHIVVFFLCGKNPAHWGHDLNLFRGCRCLFLGNRLKPSVKTGKTTETICQDWKNDCCPSGLWIVPLKCLPLLHRNLLLFLACYVINTGRYNLETSGRVSQIVSIWILRIYTECGCPAWSANSRKTCKKLQPPTDWTKTLLFFLKSKKRNLPEKNVQCPPGKKTKAGVLFVTVLARLENGSANQTVSTFRPLKLTVPSKHCYSGTFFFLFFFLDTEISDFRFFSQRQGTVWSTQCFGTTHESPGLLNKELKITSRTQRKYQKEPTAAR